MGVVYWLCGVAAAFAVFARATQIPLSPQTVETDASWDSPPHPDATGHLIFDTVYGLLKHWSNTYYRNGHNVVPATIAPGTLLFHGRGSADPTPGPEWLSFDAEHSLMFSRGAAGHLFTYAAARELRVLYFDGSSAAKMNGGPMDSQDVVMYERVTNAYFNERERIRILCEWGKEYGVDGYVRMEFDFEIMYCNFTNGLHMVSSVAPIPSEGGRLLFGSSAFGDPSEDPPEYPGGPGAPPGPPDDPNEPPRRRPGGGGGPGRGPSGPTTPPEGWRGSLRSPGAVHFEGQAAGLWHNFAALPGFKLDYSKLVSFYDPRYASLVDARRDTAKLGRAKQRLLNISAEDGALFKRDLEGALSRGQEDRGSGVSWGDIVRHIVERYADRLEFLAHLLSPVPVGSNTTAEAKLNTSQLISDVRQGVLTMLAPYLHLSDPLPSNTTNPASSRAWLTPAIHRCSSTYTLHLPSRFFTSQEQLLRVSIDTTTRQICRTLGIVWLTAFAAEETLSSPSARLTALQAWKVEINRLVDWLGWSVWVRCSPGCAADEVCNMPQWPFRGGDDPDDLTPKCIKRLPREQTGGRGPGGPGGPGGGGGWPGRDRPHNVTWAL